VLPFFRGRGADGRARRDAEDRTRLLTVRSQDGTFQIG
jgi:hypothetical protein